MEQRGKGLVITALLLASMQTPLGSTMIAVALPAISAALATDIALATGLLVTSYFIINMALQTPAGALAASFGRWRTLHLGMALFVCGAALCALAVHLWMAVAGRLMMGAGGALMAPAIMALLGSIAGVEKRGKVMGLYSAIVGLAAALGPPLGGELLHLFGWRAIFAFSLPLLAIVFVVARAVAAASDLSEPRAQASEVIRGFDWIGTALLAIALGAVAFKTIAALLVAVAAAAGFWLWESRVANPILSPRLFTNRVFAAACAVILLQSFMLYGLMFQLPQFFEIVRGADARQNGYLLLAMMAGLFFASIAGGALSDRLGARVVSLGGTAVILVALLWFFRIEALAAPAAAYGPAVLTGIGVGLTWPTAQSAALGAVAETETTNAAGVASTSRYLGAALGVLVLSALLDGASVRSVAAHLHVLYVFGVAVAVSVLACVLLPGRRQPADDRRGEAGAPRGD